MKFVRPNFDNSIVSVSATIADFLGCSDLPNVKKQKLLQKYLSKNYKNVVYMCLDGFGIYPLKQNLTKESYLRQHVAKTITSVFPSTTTNATTVLQCASYPSKYAMFGWSMYFEELEQVVAIYTGENEYTKEKVDMSKIADKIKIDPYINRANTNYQLNSIMPSYCEKMTGENYRYKNTNEMFLMLSEACSKGGRQFIYCYNEDPDRTMHEFGVTSDKAKEKINYLNNKIEEFMKNNKDTLLIITPDHGQTDIEEYIEIYKDKDLLETLKVPMYLEPRATAFQIKEGQEKRFLREMKKYKKDLKLFKTSYLIKKNFFGDYTDNLKLLGDYIAVSKNDNKIVLMRENSHRFKGHHTSLSRREMILPLIIAESKN